MGFNLVFKGLRVLVMVVEKWDRIVSSQCKLRLPRMALLGSTSTVCRNDTVILKIRAVCSTKMDSHHEKTEKKFVI